MVDEWLTAERPLPPNSIVVTVNDGYREFFRTAYPVFKAHGIPVTVFLATAFLDRKCWLWVDRIEYAFQKTVARTIELPSDFGGCMIFPLALPDQRRLAASAVKTAAKKMSNGAKLSLIVDELPERLKISMPSAPPDEYAPLLWDEVRKMASDGVSFGAHTQTHPILSSLTDRPELCEEINGSKRRIEEELGTPVHHFSYPNGMWPDITPEVIETVRNAGFRSAVTAQGGVNFRNANAFLLRRNTVEPQTPELLFGKYATGFRRN